MAYKSKLRADLHSLDEAGTNRDHTIFHNYYSELLYSKKVSWFYQMKLFCTLLIYQTQVFLLQFSNNCVYFIFPRIMKSANLRRMMSVAYTKNGNGAMNRNNSTMKRTEIKQAITLLWISVLYISCQSPKVIPDFYEAINCNYQEVKVAIKDF